jgi:hypothetical protein
MFGMVRVTTSSSTSLAWMISKRQSFPQRCFQIGRPSVLVQQVAECLIGKLLKRFHGLAREQIERVPSFLIEPHKLAPNLSGALAMVAYPKERQSGTALGIPAFAKFVMAITDGG